jgi:hypothetical protein
VMYTPLVSESATHIVRVTEATKYEAGNCATIQAGSAIAFSAEKRPDGSIVVLSAAVKAADAVDGAPQLVDIGVKVSAVSADSACPLLVFKAGPYTVKTSPDTEYVGGSCDKIAVGSRLLLNALLDAQVAPQRKAVPKTIVATRIEFRQYGSTK